MKLQYCVCGRCHHGLSLIAVLLHALHSVDQSSAKQDIQVSMIL